MSTTTTNYGLIKPDTTDPILIGQLNDNSDAIDAALKENADAIENKPDVADIPSPSTAAPTMDGTAAAGTSTDYARADHIHPSDTSKQDALTTFQLAAVNSGIDSEKVEQIETNKNNISLLETKVNTNAATISQTYNSADCNVSVFLQQDKGAIYNSTYYITSESKMHFRMQWARNQSRYWDTEDEVWTYKYRYEYFGLIATNNAEKKTWLEINIPETANETYVKKSTTTDTQVDGVGGYTWNKSNVNVGDIWYIRPYIVMTDLQFGNQFIKYGAVYKVTAGVPCTIECDTLSCTELTAAIQAIQAQLANQ